MIATYKQQERWRWLLPVECWLGINIERDYRRDRVSKGIRPSRCGGCIDIGVQAQLHQAYVLGNGPLTKKKNSRAL